MTGACMGLESAKTTLMNPCPCASEGTCSDTENAGEVDAECEASGVLGGEEQYAGMDGLRINGLRMTRASLGTRTCVCQNNFDESWPMCIGRRLQRY